VADSEKRFKRGDVVSRRYEVEKELGSGMLGTTYLARHISSDKHLAMKALRPMLVANPRDRQRFEEAFSRAKGIKHDGLVKLGEVGEHEGQVYFTQEYFPSKNLRQLLDEYQKEQKSFSLQEACQIVLKVLEAVDFLHEQGIYHRNLKPENVLIHTRRTGPGGKNLVRTVRITGAGLADVVNPTLFAESYISRAEARYLAPELSGFDQGGSATSDVYSVGVMIYELLVGQPPRGTYLSPTQLRGDLPEHIDDVVEIALGANPEDRYPSARDMINDIQRVFTDEVDDGPRGPNVRNILLAVGAGCAVLALVGVYFASRDQPDPVADAIAKDDQLRHAISAQNKPPTEAEMNAMTEKHPEMLYIPPGPFVMGRLHQEDVKTTASRSEPLSKIAKAGGFYIDRFEFPNRLADQDGLPARPVAKVTWAQASDTCEKLGKRLCSESEWEKACKGPGNWIYAYGDAYDVEMCGRGVDEPYSLGDNDTCVSGYGVWGMSGGPREWSSVVAGSKGNRRVVKGGLRSNSERGSRCAFAVDEAAGYADSTLSFRCCLGPDDVAVTPPDGEAPGDGADAPSDGAAPVEAPAE
jgi:serine/threonine protein kinase